MNLNLFIFLEFIHILFILFQSLFSLPIKKNHLHNFFIANGSRRILLTHFFNSGYEKYSVNIQIRCHLIVITGMCHISGYICP